MCSLVMQMFCLRFTRSWGQAFVTTDLNRAYHKEVFSCLCKSIISNFNSCLQVTVCVFLQNLGLPVFETTGSFSTKRWPPYATHIKAWVWWACLLFCHSEVKHSLHLYFSQHQPLHSLWSLAQLKLLLSSFSFFVHLSSFFFSLPDP